MARTNDMISTISVPDQLTAASEISAILKRAAELAASNSVALETFVQAAWAAYMDAHPGLRQELEDRELLARLDKLRARGQLGTA
jgi:hypothetical protein